MITTTTSNIKSNKIDQANSNNPVINATTSSFKSRPKTSMGYQSFLDKFNTSTTATTTLPENDSKESPLNL